MSHHNLTTFYLVRHNSDPSGSVCTHIRNLNRSWNITNGSHSSFQPNEQEQEHAVPGNCRQTLMVVVVVSQVVVVVVVSQFYGTSTPKGSYSAKTGDNDCNVNSLQFKYCTV